MRVANSLKMGVRKRRSRPSGQRPSREKGGEHACSNPETQPVHDAFHRTRSFPLSRGSSGALWRQSPFTRLI